MARLGYLYDFLAVNPQYLKYIENLNKEKTIKSKIDDMIVNVIFFIIELDNSTAYWHRFSQIWGHRPNAICYQVVETASVVRINSAAEKFSRFPRSETAMSPAPPSLQNKSSTLQADGRQSNATTGSKCTHSEMERDRIGVWGCGDGQSAGKVSGLDRLKHPGLNKVTPHTN